MAAFAKYGNLKLEIELNWLKRLQGPKFSWNIKILMCFMPYFEYLFINDKLMIKIAIQYCSFKIYSPFKWNKTLNSATNFSESYKYHLITFLLEYLEKISLKQKRSAIKFAFQKYII